MCRLYVALFEVCVIGLSRKSVSYLYSSYICVFSFILDIKWLPGLYLNSVSLSLIFIICIFFLCKIFILSLSPHSSSSIITSMFFCFKSLSNPLFFSLISNLKSTSNIIHHICLSYHYRNCSKIFRCDFIINLTLNLCLVFILILKGFAFAFSLVPREKSVFPYPMLTFFSTIFLLFGEKVKGGEGRRGELRKEKGGEEVKERREGGRDYTCSRHEIIAGKTD